MILIWSVLLCCHVAAKNYACMLALRFLLGMFDASISPAIMNIVSMFYTRSEQPLRMCVFLAFNGVATMVGALLVFWYGIAPDVQKHSGTNWENRATQEHIRSELEAQAAKAGAHGEADHGAAPHEGGGSGGDGH